VLPDMRRSPSLCSAVLLLSLHHSAAQPVITEFMADNASGLTDGAGRHSDWIEIHNPAGAPQDMAGWYLTDNPATLT
jgi:hypothetical protein